MNGPGAGKNLAQDPCSRRCQLTPPPAAQRFLPGVLRNAEPPKSQLASPAAAQGSAVNALHLRIVERPGRNLGRIAAASDVDLPVSAAEIVVVDDYLGLDHREAHGTTQCVAIGRG